jgi:hypothetical protein
MNIFRSKLTKILIPALLCTLLVFSLALAAVSSGVDVKVTNDNNNVDGGAPNPSFDAQNRQQNETTTAISPANPNIVAVGANDYRMVPVFGDSWLGFAVSADGGVTWFNTFVPGFASDTSPAGLASPLLGLDGSGDPVVRFDRLGNLYVAGIAFNRNFDQPDRPVDNLVYVARYDYTPGSPGGVSTPNSAANPPGFTYAGTAVVDRGAVGFAVPNQPFGFAGEFVDKEWMEVDAFPASPCSGSVYVTYTAFHGVGGNSPIKFSASSDGGRTFSNPRTISTGGQDGTSQNQGSDIAVGSDGSLFVAYRTFPTSSSPFSTVNVVRSTNCGKQWSQPVVAGQIATGPSGVVFRTPTFAFISVDDTNPNVVYVAYQSFDGLDYNIYVQRSTDAGATWGAPVQVNDDTGDHPQLFPSIDVSGGVLHVAWYDARHSATPSNEALDVYYAYTASYPAFSANQRVSDVSHNPNCLLFGGGAAAFHGDYIELDAVSAGASHTVHLSWADNRDVSPCALVPGTPTDNTGSRNANIYADTLIVTP